MRLTSCTLRLKLLLLLLVQTVLVSTVSSATATRSSTTTTGSSISTDPENIHAVLVSSSRYWFNYRHANNILAMYSRLRQNGVPSSNIIMMMADEIPSNARNPFKNGMYDQGIHRPSLYNLDTHIAYRGADVTVENFFNVLLGTVHTAVQTTTSTSTTSSSSRVLHTNSSSNIMIYVTGHGGDQFFKFQDEEELMADDIAAVLEQMHIRQAYRQVLFIADTCQAFTLADKISAPNVYALGTSLRGENAYAHHSDRDVGLSVIERWTYSMLQAYQQQATTSSTLQDILINPMEPAIEKLGAHLGVKDDLGFRTFDQVLLSEFFGERNDAEDADARNTKTMTAAFMEKLMVVQHPTVTTIRPPPVTRLKGELSPSLDIVPNKFVVRSSTAAGKDDAVLHPSSQEFGMLVAGLMVLVLLTSICSKRRPSETTTAHESDDNDAPWTISSSSSRSSLHMKVTKEKKL